MNQRPETENLCKSLLDIGLDSGFLGKSPTPTDTPIKAKMNQWEYIKLKSFTTTKETII